MEFNDNVKLSDNMFTFLFWADDSGGSSAGAIAGSVVAILFLLALIGVGIFLFLKYRKRNPPKFLPDNETYNPNDNPIYDELHYVAPSSLSPR